MPPSTACRPGPRGLARGVPPAPPHWGQKSNNVQGQVGSGDRAPCEWSQLPTSWGTRRGSLPSGLSSPFPSPSCSADSVGEAERTTGGQPVCPRNPVPYQGFLPAGLTSHWTLGLAPALMEDGARIVPSFCLRQKGASLGCYTSHQDSTGPWTWGGKEPGRASLRREAPRPPHPFPSPGP